MLSTPLAPRGRCLAAGRPLLLLLGLLAACPRPRATEPPRESTAQASDLRRAYDLPRTDVPWSAADYLKVRDVFVRLERERPELLPRLDGPDAALMARLAAPADLDAAARSAPDDQRLALVRASADILQLYSTRALARGDYGREYLAVAAPFFKLSAAQLETTDDAALADPARRDAFVVSRFYLARGVHDLLAGALALPAVIDPAHAATTLTSIAVDVAPWFLPEERDRMLDLFDRLAGAGRDTDLAALRTAFAPDREAHPRVDAFAEQHREYADGQESVLAAVGAGAVQPVELGRDGDRVRWAFPDAGFSAAFPQRPNAQKHNYVAADGVAMITRMLALKQPDRVSRLVTCSTRAQPIAGQSRDEARAIATTLHLEGVRTIDVEGVAGLEGTLTTETAHGLVRIVDVADTTCIVVIDVPTELARDLAAEMRRFVDSFRLAGFRG